MNQYVFILGPIIRMYPIMRIYTYVFPADENFRENIYKF